MAIKAWRARRTAPGRKEHTHTHAHTPTTYISRCQNLPGSSQLFRRTHGRCRPEFLSSLQVRAAAALYAGIVFDPLRFCSRSPCYLASLALSDVLNAANDLSLSMQSLPSASTAAETCLFSIRDLQGKPQRPGLDAGIETRSLWPGISRGSAAPLRIEPPSRLFTAAASQAMQAIVGRTVVARA